MRVTAFQYDVFVSYSHKDEEWVRNILLPTLENQGLKACIDYRDFLAGKPAIINMQDACESSRHTILVLTPNWVESEWTLYESILARSDDPSGVQRRTIPLLLKQCTPPKFISMLSWVDFTDKKREDDAWRSLFRSLDKPVQKIEIERGSVEDWYLAHPYPMPPNFTGRTAELKMLDAWLHMDRDRLFILSALGGFGKSALAWQWITACIDPGEWTKLVWWSFYEGDASFENFVKSTLAYLKVDLPPGQRPQVDELLKAMQTQKILIVLDGFERVLRAYNGINAAYQGDEESEPEENQLDCVNINAETFLKSICSLPGIKSKVLMTTRLSPRAVKPRGEFMFGCRQEELTAMQKEDAVVFFRRQGIKGTYAEIAAACALYGFHPLSLRLLAGRILRDFENPRDIVVARRLKIDGDLVQQKHHVLEVSYNSLPSPEQRLLGIIACFRSPVEFKTLEELTESKKSLDTDLRDLINRGLLHFDEKNKRFDLHPIVRRYAYNIVVGKDAIHKRLAEYFETRIVDAYLENHGDLGIPRSSLLTILIERSHNSNDLLRSVELYYHLLKSGQSDKVLEFNVSLLEALSNASAYATIIELFDEFFMNLEYRLLLSKSPDKMDLKFNILVSQAYDVTGRTYSSIQILSNLYNHLQESTENNVSIAWIALSLAFQLQATGRLREADRFLRRGLELSNVTNNKYIQSQGQLYLGHAFSRRGAWKKANQAFVRSRSLLKDEDATENKANGFYWLLRSILELSIVRDARKNRILQLLSGRNLKLAIQFAGEALDWETSQYEEMGGDHLLGMIQAGWILGAAYHYNKAYTLAEQHLMESLTHCRSINFVHEEAEILLDVARLRYDQRKVEEAKSLAEEALTITERCGYSLQGADANLFLAQHALEQERDRTKAKEYAQAARKLAYCDGPPYYYKVAFQEAERMLRALK